MFDARFDIADGVGELERFFAGLFEQMESDSLGGAGADPGESGELLHQVLDTLRVIIHVCNDREDNRCGSVCRRVHSASMARRLNWNSWRDSIRCGICCDRNRL